jgi:predicted metal-dependent hydrolase
MDGLVEGVRAFNSGAYFEAHEAFEALLDEAEDDDVVWQVLIGLVQVSVGYHKAASGHPGAERMLGLGMEKLAPLPDVVAGVAVQRLRQRVSEDLTAAGSLATRLASSPPRIELRGARP